jgi:hypothetical protein
MAIVAIPVYNPVPPGGTVYAGIAAPPYYVGDGTFATLQSVVDGIASTGGWAQISGTTLQSVAPSNSAIDAISPSPVLRGTTYPNNFFSVWGSAAWTGHSFFVGAVGGHYAYWGNDLYCIRLSDPPAAIHVYNPAPIGAVAYRNDGAGQTAYAQGELVPEAAWGSLPTSAVEHAWPTWGPRSVHQYSGMAWDSAHKLVLLGGSNQSTCTNPEAVGETGAAETSIWTYDPLSVDPQTAWVPTLVNGAGSDGIFGLVQDSSGDWAFRTISDGSAKTLNLTTRGVAESGSPMYDIYSPWRTVLRDPATGKYYEIHRSDLGDPYVNSPYRLSLFETTTGSYVSVVQLPADYVSQDADKLPGVVIVDSVAYVWGSTSKVVKIALSTGDMTEFSDGTSIGLPPAGYNGTWGRWAYVPEVGAFVGLASEAANAWVFRPPAAWGV